MAHHANEHVRLGTGLPASQCVALLSWAEAGSSAALLTCRMRAGGTYDAIDCAIGDAKVASDAAVGLARRDACQHAFTLLRCQERLRLGWEDPSSDECMFTSWPMGEA
jgi:hypothetical protein